MEFDVNFKKSNHFNNLVTNYISKKKEVEHLYGLYPTYQNLKKQAKAKILDFKNRDILVESLTKQNNSLDLSKLQQNNLNLLSNLNSVTITTGHQLNLMGGPLYTIYKIVQTIKLCDDLNKKNQSISFIPVFWMATEDHDWAEINNFNYNNTKFEWENIPKEGAAGVFSVIEIKNFLNNFIDSLEEKKYKKELINLIELSYLDKNTTNLSDANRKLFHELFKESGLLILDANQKEIKKLFIPYFKNEINNQSLFNQVSNTISKFNRKEIQVNPREINLFYLDKNIRERIIKKGDSFAINNTELVFNQKELLKLIEDEPEKFSPNVLLRPLLQEVTLPNVAYIGGGSEISYWLQLKSFFENQEILFPILIPRNSITILNQKQFKKLEKLTISFEEILLAEDILVNKKIKEKSNLKIDFIELKKEVNKIYGSLAKKALKTDVTFLNLVTAQKTKQLNAINALEKRLLKAERIKQSVYTNKIKELKNSLFPNKTYQERVLNFSNFYINHEIMVFKKIYDSINPLEFNFTFIVLE